MSKRKAIETSYNGVELTYPYSEFTKGDYSNGASLPVIELPPRAGIVFAMWENRQPWIDRVTSKKNPMSRRGCLQTETLPRYGAAWEQIAVRLVEGWKIIDKTSAKEDFGVDDLPDGGLILFDGKKVVEFINLPPMCFDFACFFVAEYFKKTLAERIKERRAAMKKGSQND